MNIYVIHAFDEIFGALHGVEDWDMIEAEDSSELAITAYNMSCEVIDSYSYITDTLIERANDLLAYDIDDRPSLTSQERDWLFEQYYKEEVKGDVCFTITKLNDQHSLEEYQEMLDSGEYDYEDLVEEFGVEKY